jgi:hypothetical protein
MFKLLLASSMIVMTAVPLVAAAPKAKEAENHPVYTDPGNAGPDFAVQGEYASIHGDKYGADVVALGDNEFQVVLLAGGLPGDGYDGKGRTELKATREGDAIKLQAAEGYSGAITGGMLAVQTPHGSIDLAKVNRESPAAGAKPPEGAVVLFDGTNTDHWKDGKIDSRHLLEQGAETKKKYQSFTMHLEFMLPFKPFGRDQDRGNSGVYIQRRYEVQVLDTFGHPSEFNGCGSMYRQHAPIVNMCYPPLQWQTYDIDFQAAKFDASGKKTHNAVITLKQNGVVVQDQYELTNKTGAGSKEGPEAGPIWLQEHHNPVVYRNIWIVEK